MEITKLQLQVGKDWAELLKDFMVEDAKGECPYKPLVEFISSQKAQGINFFPIGRYIYRCFRETPLAETRVIILGQDPYFVPGYATGLAFASEKPGEAPITLRKIFEGVEDDLYHGVDLAKNERDASLVPWAKQGVLLLNSSLTVEEGKPDSHSEEWKPFMKNLVQEVQKVKRDMIWVAFGGKAKEFVKDVNPFRSFVFTAEHPAAAARDKNRAWKHNNVFSKVNLALKLNGLGPEIVW